MEAVLFLCCIALCIVTGINFIKRDDRENTRLEAIETKQNDQDERQKAILDRLDKLSQPALPSPTPQVVNLHLEKPIEITIIEKPRPTPKPILPDPPEALKGKKGQKVKFGMGRLMKRANMPEAPRD